MRNRDRKTYIARAVAAMLTSFLVAGCASTLEGAKEDVGKDTRAVGAAAHKAGDAVKNAGATAHQAEKNVGEALVLTPKIKLAIIRDPLLNNKRNLVNVESKGNTVHLTGHVITQRMKDRAGEDAQLVLDNHQSTEKLVNDLAVSEAP